MTVALIVLLAAQPARAQLAVSEPDGIGDVVAEGLDFAVQEIGDAWDMANPADVVTTETLQIRNEAFSGGVYRGITDGGDPQFYLTFQGVFSSVLTMDRGQRYPIATADYRYLAARVRYRSAAGGTLPNASIPTIAYFYRDENSLFDAATDDGTFGCSAVTNVAPNDWQILVIDLWQSQCGLKPKGWLDFTTIKGLRINPTLGAGNADVRFEYDWIRLVPEGGSAQKKTVTWTGGSGPFAVAAFNDSTEVTLGSGIAGRSFVADFSILPPGNWNVRVSGGGQSAVSPGPVTINAAPQLTFTQPDLRGDEANSYAAAVVGNPWGPLSAVDVELTRNISNLSYNSPAGTLTGVSDPSTAITGDPYILWRSTEAIDTERYRLVCYTMEIEGDRNIGAGSVARILYGNDTAVPFATTDDIIVQEGLNEYCIGDLRDIQLEGGLPHDWFGALNHIRLDPLEFPTSRAFRVDEFLLAPFDTANPGFAFRWVDADADDDATIDLYIDPDRNPDNGNEIAVVTGLSENSGSDSFAWTAPGQIPPGLYQVMARVDDGRNQITRYALAPLQVGAATSVALAVTEPDGVGDLVSPAPEYSRDERGNPWDMANEGDVVSTGGLANVAYSGGVFRGNSTNSDPQLILLDAASNPRPVDTGAFRYLTVKLRVTGPGTHFMNAFWFVDPATFGFTDGIVVDNGEWQILTLDLTDESNAAAIAWRDNATVRGLRLDPSTQPGANVEIDWITLTGDGPAAEFQVRWAADNLPNSSFSVFVGDDQARVLVAEGLGSNVRSATADLSRFPRGSYQATVIADPGPTAMSAGQIVLGADLIFGAGFE